MAVRTIKNSINWHAKVLEVLRNHSGAMSAYDVLAELRQFNPKIAPPTVYRALAALAKQGRVHRLESINAFVACQCDQHPQAPVLSVCDDCGVVEESIAPQVLSALSDVARQSEFALTHQVIELHGRCIACRDGVS